MKFKTVLTAVSIVVYLASILASVFYGIYSIVYAFRNPDLTATRVAIHCLFEMNGAKWLIALVVSYITMSIGVKMK